MDALVLQWPGGEHAFRLTLSHLEVVQDKTGCGPEHLLHKINSGQWVVVDLVEVLRNGLIGGGMGAAEAAQCARKAFELHPLIGFKVPAQAVLAAAIYGPPDDPVGEPQPVEPTPGD